MPHPLLYELNTRCWLRELSEQAGNTITLANTPESQFAQWQGCGISHIWLMGVWTSGPLARAKALANPGLQQAYTEALPDWTEADVAGSPYAIADYAVPASLGGEEALDIFRQRLHAQGQKLVLDFVPNHLGLDHPWLRERPELFVQSLDHVDGSFRQDTRDGPRWLAHGKDPYFPAWTDTVQLDYRRDDTRQAMIALLQSVAKRCDGVRCDMAMLLLNDVFARTWAAFPVVEGNPPSEPVLSAAKPPKRKGADSPRPPEGRGVGGEGSTAAQVRGETVASGQTLPQTDAEFWATATRSIKAAYPDFLFLAEAYWGTESRLQTLGFDFTYDKTLYDRLMAHDAAGVQAHVFGLSPQRLSAGAHFLENHDEPRVASCLTPSEQRAAALAVLGLPGMRFLHEGQLAGARRRLPVQLARRMAEAPQADTVALYEELLKALNASAVGRGTYELITPAPAWPGNPTVRNFVILRWQREAPEFDLVVVNLASHRSQCFAPLSQTAGQTNWALRDVLSSERYVRKGEELDQRGLYLDLPRHGAQIFKFTPC
jgi:glycosidase